MSKTLRELGSRLGFETEVVPAVHPPRPRGEQQPRFAVCWNRAGCRWPRAGWNVPMRSKAKSSRAAASVPPDRAHLESLHPAELIPNRRLRHAHRRSGYQRAWNSGPKLGYRPTFGDSTQLTIETFLLDPLAGRNSAPHFRRVSLARARRAQVHQPGRAESAHPPRRRRGAALLCAYSAVAPASAAPK